MPITSSAKKAIRSSLRKKAFNLKRKRAINSVVKKYSKLILDKKIEEARKLVPVLQKAIDKGVKTGLIKKNTAARKKSRLMKKLT